MNETKMFLILLWIALALVYLLGDVFRIFAGDFKIGEAGGFEMTQGLWLGIAAVMLIPILMILFTFQLDQPINRWLNIGVAVFFFLFNIVGLPTYPGLYDKFLIAVSLGMNVMTVYTAWNWSL
jgi:hypothetical protein